MEKTRVCGKDQMGTISVKIIICPVSKNCTFPSKQLANVVGLHFWGGNHIKLRFQNNHIEDRENARMGQLRDDYRTTSP